jgi:Pyruvate/2-oxoacid:ferredoxin oxidoreductase delta subunit
LFGLNFEDLEGINLLTKYFSKPIEDKVFTDRMEKTIVVAIDRFSPPKNLDYDLYLMEFTPGLFAIIAKTKKGLALTKNNLFTTKNVHLPSVKKKKDTILENKNLSLAIEKAAGHPIWKELAEKCFGCGICTYACPVCYCFHSTDKTEVGAAKGERCRQWDSCLLSSFAKTNAGDFRSTLEKRIYNWYLHKFVRSQNEYGQVGCVDCNRCIIFCPARIDFKRVLSQLLKDYENEKL